ncbi:MAG: transposase [Ignavibacteriae bacterium]|nr:transposase [Ignavibacteriota bacterium]
MKSWRANWDNLTCYFDFPVVIRTIIYTTNVIECINSSIRKYNKTKTVFPVDQAVIRNCPPPLKCLSVRQCHIFR